MTTPFPLEGSIQVEVQILNPVTATVSTPSSSSIEVKFPGPQGPKGDKGDTGTAAVNVAQTWTKAHRWEPDTNVTPITLKANVSQTADLLSWTNNGNVVLGRVTSAGWISAPTVNAGAASNDGSVALFSQPTAATQKALILRGAVSQSANLVEIQNNAGGMLVRVDAAGLLYEGANRVYSAGNANLASATPNAIVYGGVGAVGTGVLFARNDHVHPLAAAVVAAIAGTGVSVSAATGSVTFANTGVLTVGASGNLASSGGQNPAITLLASPTFTNVSLSGSNVRYSIADGTYTTTVGMASTSGSYAAGSLAGDIVVRGDAVGNTQGVILAAGPTSSTVRLTNTLFAIGTNTTIAGTLNVTGNVTEAGVDLATEPYVDSRINALIGAAPGTLDTLNELAAALGNDPNFATTITNNINTRALDTSVVHLAGAESVTGVKTFTTQQVFNGGMLIPTSASIFTFASTDANWRIGMNIDNTGTAGVGSGFIRKYATSHVQYISYAPGSATQGFAVGPNAAGGLSHLEIRASDGLVYARNDIEVGRDLNLGRTDISPAISAGTGIRFLTDSGDRLFAFDNRVNVNAKLATQVAFAVTGAATQSGNLTEWRNSAAAVQARVDPSGRIYAAGFEGFSRANHYSIMDTASTETIRGYYQAEVNSRWSIGGDNYSSGNAGISFNQPGQTNAAGGVKIGIPTTSTMAFSTSNGTAQVERLRIGTDITFQTNAYANGIVQLNSIGPATATLHQDSRRLQWQSNYWNGTASVSESFYMWDARQGAQPGAAGGHRLVIGLNGNPDLNLFNISGDGSYNVGIGESFAQTAAQLRVITTAAAKPAIVARAAATQTANISQWESSAGAILAAIGPLGQVVDNGNRVYSASNANLASTVVDERGFGLAPAVGTSTLYSRGDHTHGNNAQPVTSAVAGSGIGVSAATGAVTFTNTGVTGLIAGAGITVSGATGAVTVSSTTPANVVTTDTVQTIVASKTFTASAAAAVPVTVRQATTQTGNLMEFRSTDGTVILSRIASDGTLFVGSQSYGPNGSLAANGVTTDTAQTITASKTFSAATVFSGGDILVSGASAQIRVASRTSGDADAIWYASTGLMRWFAGSDKMTLNLTTGALNTIGAITENGVRVYSATTPPPYPVTTVAGRTGAVTLTTADVANSVDIGSAQSITGLKSFTTGIQLVKGGNSTDTTSTATQVLFGHAGTANYRHAIRTRHNSGSQLENAFDFFVWKVGTDLIGAEPTARALTIDAAQSTFYGSVRGLANVAADVPLIAQGAASQTGDLMQFKDSAGNVLSRVANDGTIYKGTQVVGGNAADTEIMAIMGGF